MRIAWVIPCRYLEVHEGLATIVGGGIDRMHVPSLPALGPVQLLLAVRIVAEPGEIDPEVAGSPGHAMVCRVYSPSMQVVSELQHQIGIAGVPDPVIDAAVILPVEVIFEPQEAGQHTIEIAIDDRGVSVPLTIVDASTEEG